MKIAVVGSGYVGLVAGACFAELGHDVILVDNDHGKLATLSTARVPSMKSFFPNCWRGIGESAWSLPAILPQPYAAAVDFHRRGNAAQG